MIFFIALRKEIFELIRTYRLLVSAVLLIFFGLISPLLARYMRDLMALIPDVGDLSSIIPPPTIMDAVIQYVKYMTQFGLLLALFFGMGSVAHEKETGTAGMILVKPIPRSVFILAKFIALSLLFLVSLSLAGLGCYYYTYLLFDALDLVGWLLLNGLLVLQLLVYTAITLLCSTLMRTQIAAGGTAVGTLIIMSIFSAIPGWNKYFPGELSNWGTRLLNGEAQASWIALIVSIAIISASLSIAIISFKRQEL